MLKRLRERAGSESGFTLIELLVVMLILGILAAIAIPAFLNQKNKATDSSAKVTVRSMQTAMETCATDKSGKYTGCDLPTLKGIESTIPDAPKAVVDSATDTGYKVTAVSDSGNTFSIQRAGGTFTRSCVVASGGDKGGCPNGSW